MSPAERLVRWGEIMREAAIADGGLEHVVQQLLPGIIGNPFLPHFPHPKQLAALAVCEGHDDASGPFEMLFGGAAGGGKLSPVETPVLTPKGWRAIGDLRVGDSITDPTTGGACRVIAVHPQGERDVYRVTMDDGAAVDVGLEHLWAYKPNGHTNKRPGTKAPAQRERAAELLGTEPRARDRWATLRVGTTADLIAQLERGRAPRIPLTEPVLYTVNGRAASGPLDPYFLGLYLGDGCHTGSVTNVDPEIRDYLRGIGCTLDTAGRSACVVGDLRKRWATWCHNHKLTGLRAWEKFLPDYVHTAPIDYRVALLQGLMDSDGTVDDRGRCSFTSTSERLASAVVDLVRGLGGKARLRERQTHYTLHGEKVAGRPSYTVRIWARRTSSLFRLGRKRARCLDRWNGGAELMREVVSIERTRRAESVCITVDSPAGLYVTSDFIVTHNSDWILQAVAARAGRPECGHYRAVILRRTHAEMMKSGAVLSRAIRWWIPKGAAWDGTNKMFRFPNGATVEFGYHTHPTDDTKYQGGEWHDALFDELTHWPDDGAFEWLRTRLRTNENDPLGRRLLATSNPGQAGHDWVKERFVGGKEIGGKVIVPRSFYLPSKIDDNPSLSRAAYIATLENVHPTRRAQLLDGDWSARDPGDYFRVEWFGPILDEAPTTECVAVRWWDLAASESEDAARTAGVRMLRMASGVRIVAHAVAFRATPGKRDARIVAQAKTDGRGTIVGLEIEPGSGGIAQFEALAARLRAEGFRVVGARPSHKAPDLTDEERATLSTNSPGDRGKIARADPVASCLERGYQRRGECAESADAPWWGLDIGRAVTEQRDGIRVVGGEWLQGYLDELEGFPQAKLKDLVDATSGAWAWLQANPYGRAIAPGGEPKPRAPQHPEDENEDETGRSGTGHWTP